MRHGSLHTPTDGDGDEATKLRPWQEIFPSELGFSFQNREQKFTTFLGKNLVRILAMLTQRRYNINQCDFLRNRRKNNGFQRHCNAKPISEIQVRILVPPVLFQPDKKPNRNRLL
jgi:hypothetical protein